MSLFDIEVGYSKEFLIDLWEKGGDVVTLSGIYRRKDGSTFPAEVRVGEITFRGQNLRLAATRDITERRQAEEALRERRTSSSFSTTCWTAMHIARYILSKGGPWISFSGTSIRPSET